MKKTYWSACPATCKFKTVLYRVSAIVYFLDWLQKTTYWWSHHFPLGFYSNFHITPCQEEEKTVRLFVTQTIFEFLRVYLDVPLNNFSVFTYLEKVSFSSFFTQLWFCIRNQQSSECSFWSNGHHWSFSGCPLKLVKFFLSKLCGQHNFSNDPSRMTRAANKSNPRV